MYTSLPLLLLKTTRFLPDSSLFPTNSQVQNHFLLTDRLFRQAIDAGMEVGFYPVEWLNGKALVKADHNKMLSIDGMEAMIGGMNFADAIAGNHDLMLWIKGPAVAELDEIFNDNWRACKMNNARDQEATHLWQLTDEVLDAATEKTCP